MAAKPRIDPVVLQIYTSHWPKIAQALDSKEGEKTQPYEKVIERVLAHAFMAGRENISLERRDPGNLNRATRFKVKIGKKVVTGRIDRRAAPRDVLKMANQSEAFQAVVIRAKRKEELIPHIREAGGLSKFGAGVEPLQNDMLKFIELAHGAGRNEIRRK